MVTKLAASTRYFLPGTTKVYIVPLVANMTTGPTRIELDAGTDVSDEIAAISGWLVSADSISAPDLGARFAGSVSGRITAADSSLTFYADKLGDDVRETLTLDLETHVVFLDGGDAPAAPMDVYKVQVGSNGKLREIEALGRIEARFNIRKYAENLTVPAGA